MNNTLTNVKPNVPQTQEQTLSKSWNASGNFFQWFYLFFFVILTVDRWIHGFHEFTTVVCIHWSPSFNDMPDCSITHIFIHLHFISCTMAMEKEYRVEDYKFGLTTNLVLLLRSSDLFRLTHLNQLKSQTENSKFKKHQRIYLRLNGCTSVWDREKTGHHSALPFSPIPSVHLIKQKKNKASLMK